MTHRSPRSLNPLAQLDQHSIPVRRMEKRDAASLRAGHRRFVDEAVSLTFEIFEMPFEIRYTKTDVMDSLTAPFDEPSDGRIFRHRLEQFQIGVADADEGRLHALRFDAFDMIDREPEGGVDAGGVEGADRDADVVESRFDH